MSGNFTDHFVITGVERLTDHGLVLVSIRFDTGPRVYEFYIPFDDYTYDKEKIGQQIQSQLG